MMLLRDPGGWLVGRSGKGRQS